MGTKSLAGFYYAEYSRSITQKAEHCSFGRTRSATRVYKDWGSPLRGNYLPVLKIKLFKYGLKLKPDLPLLDDLPSKSDHRIRTFYIKVYVFFTNSTDGKTGRRAAASAQSSS